ncbi:MAG: septation protein IspZ, partial [Verrucomicrobiota bacterium]
MKMFYDFLPVLLFFVAYKFYGIKIATAVLMVACAIQVGGHAQDRPAQLVR